MTIKGRLAKDDDYRKPCEYCGKPCEPSPSETRSKYRNRRFCNATCANYARTLPPPEKKVCEYCKEEYEKPPRQSHAKWRERKYCKQACASRDQGKNGKPTKKRIEDYERRTCEYCGEKYERRQKEDLFRYKQRKFCSLTCSANYRNKHGNHTKTRKPKETNVDVSVFGDVIKPEKPVWRPTGWPPVEESGAYVRKPQRANEEAVSA